MEFIAPTVALAGQPSPAWLGFWENLFPVVQPGLSGKIPDHTQSQTEPAVQDHQDSKRSYIFGKARGSCGVSSQILLSPDLN